MKENGQHRFNAISVALWCAYYGFAMLFATHFAFFDVGKATAFITVQHVLLLVCAFLAGVLLKGARARIAARISSVLLAALLIAATCVPVLRGSVYLGAVLGILFGLCCYDVLQTFSFGMNSAERLVAAVGGNVMLCALGFLPSYFGRQSVPFYAACAALAAVGALLSQFLSPVDIPEPQHKESSLKYRSALKFNLVLGLAGGIFSTGAVVFTMNNIAAVLPYARYAFYGAGIVACGLYFLTGKTVANFLELGLNVTFACTAIGIAAAFFDVAAVMYVAAGFCGAAFCTGMLSVYIGVGELTCRYSSRKFLLYALAVIGIFGGGAVPVILIFLGDGFGKAAAIAAASVCVAIMLLMLVAAPYIFKKAALSAEEERTEGKSGEAKDRDSSFSEYNLSARETEVARLLLKGMTMRQIAAELSISYSTVNTHCTCIYRKCGINSRTELILLFR